MAGCQNDGRLLGPLNMRCRVILRTIMLTTTHIEIDIEIDTDADTDIDIEI